MIYPTFAIVVTFQIKPAYIRAFLVRVQRQAKTALTEEEGCKQFDVLIDEGNPSTIVLYQTYVDSPAFDTHRATPHFTDFNETVIPWLISIEVRRFDLLKECR